MFYGLFVIGPPGSGKTTFCYGLYQFLTEIKKLEDRTSDNKKKIGRKVALVNLDPANECIPYVPDIDIRSIINIEQTMQDYKLGPNGAMLKCLELLEKNVDWLLEELYAFAASGFDYFIFDCPGQIEIYTHHQSLTNILAHLARPDNYLSKGDNFSLTLTLGAVNLIDALYCTDPGKYIAATLQSLTAMLHLQLPHVNLLSKVDLVLPRRPPESKSADWLDYDLSYYTEVLDLSHLVERLDEDPFFHSFKKMNAALCGVIEDYSLVSYVPCNVQDKKCMRYVCQLLDKALGYTPFISQSTYDDEATALGNEDPNSLDIGEGTLHFPDLTSELNLAPFTNNSTKRDDSL